MPKSSKFKTRFSGSLEELIRSTKQNDHVDISSLERGTVISITTQDSMFTMVVVKPEEGLVVITGLHGSILNPHVATFHGATNGGNAVKIHHIIVSMMMRMGIDGGLMVTSRVREFSIIRNDSLRDRYLEVWKRIDELPEFDERVFNGIMEKSIERDFSPDLHDRIRKVLADFNWEGKGIMLRILLEMYKVGRIEEAFEVISKYFNSHWGYRPPEARGSFLTPSDVKCVHDMYHELDLPLPDGVS